MLIAFDPRLLGRCRINHVRRLCEQANSCFAPTVGRRLLKVMKSASLDRRCHSSRYDFRGNAADEYFAHSTMRREARP